MEGEKCFINDTLTKDSLYIEKLHRKGSKNAYISKKYIFYICLWERNKHHCILNSALVPFFYETEINI